MLVNPKEPDATAQRGKGRRLKGPEMVTVKEFNQRSGADGINFLTTEKRIALDPALLRE